MRRRLIDVGRIKRLPSRRTRPPELPPNNTLLHVKLFFGWSVVVLLDILVGFRLEYLYPAVMFIRSVLDSYKYQGLVFSVLFIVLVIYLDMLCWTLLVGPWLFLIASSCVWLEMIRNWDHIFGYSSILLWMFFLYVEISQRMHTVSPAAIVSFSRPFAAHCIGYPVITMSFLIKHHLLHVFRQRQQRQVAEENSHCFNILLKALPSSADDGECEDESDRSSIVAMEDVVTELPKTKEKNIKKKDSVSSKSSSSKNGHRNNGRNGTAPTKRDPSPSFKSLEPKTPTGSPTGTNGFVTATTATSSVSNNNSISNSTHKPPPHKSSDSPTGSDVVVGNGDIVRPSSGKISGPVKKQAMVKAVPRTDLQQQMDARDKANKSNESLLIELKEERMIRSNLEQEIAKQHKEIKRLHADFHASRLQEEEAAQRINVLLQQDRLSRMDIQRMRNELENTQQRLSKMSTSKSRDMDSISSLEEQLKGEVSSRQRLELQLREQRSQASSQNQWSKEEVKEIRDKLTKKEKELAAAKDSVQHLQMKYQEVHGKLNAAKREAAKSEEKCQQLEASLSDVTRVKIELFSYLSEATRKQEGLVEEIRKKDAEIEGLKQRMQQLVAIQSTWTPSLSPHH